VIVSSSGCAGLTVKPVGTNESKVHGFRYYEPSPYLLVYTDNRGGLTTRLLWLPDQTKKRSARPYAYLASNDVTLSFTNGVLTQAAVTVDETIVPKAVVEALEQAAALAVKGAGFREAAAEQQNIVPPPYLFKIVVESAGPGKGRVWMLKGAQGSGGPIKVTFTESAK
jgi:hypothetical protein